MSFLARLIALINVPVNAAAGFLLNPIGRMPGWLSITMISAVVGVFLLIIFKLTSNQAAIGLVRDDIKANMLALRLFKESISVTMQLQARLFRGSAQLLVYSIVPLLVMILPVSMFLAQLGLWYQSRPLAPEEETIVTMKLNPPVDSPWPRVNIASIPKAEVVMGPVRILSKQEVCWKIRAIEKGYSRIVFDLDDRHVEKELAIGDGFMRVSGERPGWSWSDILLHPGEKPFAPGSPVRSISIDYPDRPSRTSGTDRWVLYFFFCSLVFAVIFKPLLKVRI